MQYLWVVQFFLFIKHNQPWFQFFFLPLFWFYHFLILFHAHQEIFYVRTNASDIHFSCESVGISSLIFPPFFLVFFLLFLLFVLLMAFNFYCIYISTRVCLFLHRWLQDIFFFFIHPSIHPLSHNKYVCICIKMTDLMMKTFKKLKKENEMTFHGIFLWRIVNIHLRLKPFKTQKSLNKHHSYEWSFMDAWWLFGWLSDGQLIKHSHAPFID